MFLVIGAVGALLLVIGLVIGDALEGVLPESDWLSLTAIAAFLTAFGFAGLLIDSRTGAGTAVASIVGLAAGVGLGYVALSWSRSLSNMATDGTPSSNDLVGRQGRVITEVLPGSTGEVIIQVGGQPMKLTGVVSADRSESLKRGAEIVVVNAISSTRVEIQPADEFWGSTNQERKQI
ncbi:MAG: hypothetical protein ACRBK7_27510 [Acidimicrobiales bacterium]